MSEHSIIQPEDWPRPRGYSNGIAASGRILALAGQIGWDPKTEKLVSADFAAQTRQALQNIAVLLNEASAWPTDVVRMTWYITDRAAYINAAKEIGAAYRELFGAHYPAMSVVVVAALLEPGAVVEIEALAVKTT